MRSQSVAEVKRALDALGPVLPGSISKQWNVCVPSVSVCDLFFPARGGRSAVRIRFRPVPRRWPGSSRASKRQDLREHVGCTAGAW